MDNKSSDIKILFFIFKFMYLLGLIVVGFVLLGTVVAFIGWAWRLF